MNTFRSKVTLNDKEHLTDATCMVISGNIAQQSRNQKDFYHEGHEDREGNNSWNLMSCQEK